MSTETISLQIDADAAQAFRATSGDEQEKLGVLLGIWLKEYAKAGSQSLKKTMDEISQQAQGRGLTPEILESILGEK